MKRSTGDILAVHEIRERKNDTVKNYAITIKYNSRSGTHNMYKEYRDTALVGAVEQMYAELAGRHRARFSSIHIVDGRVAPVAVKRSHMKQLLKNKIAFPLPHRLVRPTSKAFRTTFKASRPTTFFG